MRSGNALQGKRELYYLTTYKFWAKQFRCSFRFESGMPTMMHG
jgi:hypothetical protein